MGRDVRPGLVEQLHQQTPELLRFLEAGTNSSELTEGVDIVDDLGTGLPVGEIDEVADIGNPLSGG